MLRNFSDLTTRLRPRVWLALAAVGGAAVLSGCVVAPVPGDGDYAYHTSVYTTYGYPPPPIVEYHSVAPSPYHVWINGNWFWGGHRYTWRPGYWAAPSYRPAPPAYVRPAPRPQRPPYAQPPGSGYRPDRDQRPPRGRADRDHDRSDDPSDRPSRDWRR